jgi:hypothetical protein
MKKSLARHLALAWCSAFALSACGDDSGVSTVSESSSDAGDDDDDDDDDDDSMTDPSADDDADTTATDPTEDTTDTTADDTTDDTGETCGNGAVDPGEDCDGSDLGRSTCESEGFDAGDLACAADCTFDTSACTNDKPVCGDDAIGGSEECDGTDLDGQDCTDHDFDGGTLGCSKRCTFDTSECTNDKPGCGNDTVEGAEECDGTDLADQDCVSLGLGFDGGTLGCSKACEFDTSACTSEGPACVEPQDFCADPADDCVCNGCVDDGSCGSDDCVCDDCYLQGFCGGDVCLDDGACDPYLEGCLCADCAEHPECLDNPTCGDGVIAPPETCEGDDLGGQDCLSLGFTGGTLVCDGACNLDDTGCTIDGWTCPLQYYNAGPMDGCDCGCGIMDPDCADASVASCQWCNDTGSCDTTASGCPGIIDPDDNSQCDPLALWTCNVAFYGDGDCDCGCGVVDVDCADATVASCEFCNDTGSCDDTGAGCPGIIDPVDNSTCTVVGGECIEDGGDCTDPAECSCVGCDGDAVCELTDDCTCDECDTDGFCSTACTLDGACDPYNEGCACADCADTAACDDGGVPAEWTCNVAFYGDGDCDCGCGALDVDCADATVASCEFCNDTGSCDDTGAGCPGIIDPVDNSTCTGGGGFACADADIGGATGANVASGTTAGSDADLAMSCGGTNGADHVMTFTAGGAGNYTFDTVGSDYDTKLSVWSDCATQLSCNDDIGFPNLQSSITQNLAAGQTVAVAVGGYNGGTGNWVLNISGPV